jgi:hypothetical protein
MKAGIDTEVTVATAWETKVSETFTKRSFLFQMLGKPISVAAFETDWKSGCAFGPETGTKPCDLIETLPIKKNTTKGAIVFEWATCYNTKTQNATIDPAADFKCSPHGLDDDAATTGAATDGLKSVAKAKLGLQNDSTVASKVTATGLFKAYETANYEYIASGTTKLAAALTAYQEW